MTSSVWQLGAAPPPARKLLQPTLSHSLPLSRETSERPRAGPRPGIWAPAGRLCAEGAGEHPGSPTLGSGDCSHAQPQDARALLACVGPQVARDVM